MSEIKDFQTLYSEIKANNKEKINMVYDDAKQESQKRKKYTLIVCLTIDIMVILVIIINLFSNANNVKGNLVSTGFPIVTTIFSSIPIMLTSNIFAVVIFSFIFNKNGRKYKEVFKESIVKDVISNFYVDAKYNPISMMPSNIYKEGFNEYYENYRSDDYISGKIDGKYDVCMADIYTTKTERDSDGDNHTVTVFSGMFAKLELKKSIKCNFKISPNGYGMFNKNRVKMDSDEFEKKYDVGCDNNIIAMQLLTHDIMELLLDFINKEKIRYELYINNDILYMRFYTGPMFEDVSFKEEGFDTKVIQKYYNILNFINNLTLMIVNTVNETEI